MLNSYTTLNNIQIEYVVLIAKYITHLGYNLNGKTAEAKLTRKFSLPYAGNSINKIKHH